jgi:SAM-dependent methyltransferase
MASTCPSEPPAVLRPAFDPPLTACALCGGTGIRDYDRDFRGVTIARCDGCGVKFMNPQYTDDYLVEYYAGYTREEQESPERRAMRIAQKTEKIALVERYMEPGRFFSIGCGDGTELRVATSRGWSAEGYDVDPVTCERIARRTGVPIHSGDLYALSLEDARYDCVYLDQVLEHPKTPGEHLRVCHRILKPGGVLLIAVPNIDSLSSSLKTLLGRTGLKRRRGKHYDSWHHLFYYSPATLPALLERHYDFRVLLVQGDPKPKPRPTIVTRVHDWAARRMPALDSTFVLLAQRAR